MSTPRHARRAGPRRRRWAPTSAGGPSGCAGVPGRRRSRPSPADAALRSAAPAAAPGRFRRALQRGCLRRGAPAPAPSRTALPWACPSQAIRQRVGRAERAGQRLVGVATAGTPSGPARPGSPDVARAGLPRSAPQDRGGGGGARSCRAHVRGEADRPAPNRHSRHPSPPSHPSHPSPQQPGRTRRVSLSDSAGRQLAAEPAAATAR